MGGEALVVKTTEGDYILTSAYVGPPTIVTDYIARKISGVKCWLSAATPMLVDGTRVVCQEPGYFIENRERLASFWG